MEILSSMISLIGKNSNSLSRKHLSKLLDKQTNLTSKLYLLIESGNYSEMEIANSLGYESEKEKKYIMLKKRLRDFLVANLKLGSIADYGDEALDVEGQLEELMSLVKLFEADGHYDSMYIYNQKALKLASQNGYFDVWQKCLEIEYRHIARLDNIKLLRAAAAAIKKLNQEVSFIKSINHYLIMEAALWRGPISKKEWEEHKIEAINKLDFFNQQLSTTSLLFSKLAVINAQLFTYGSLGDTEKLIGIAQRGDALIGENTSIKSSLIFTLHGTLALGYLMVQDFKSFELLLKRLHTFYKTNPNHKVILSTLTISFYLHQHKYELACSEWKSMVEQASKSNLGNVSSIDTKMSIKMTLDFLCLNHKISSEQANANLSFLELEKDIKMHSAYPRDYRDLLLYLSLLYLSTNKMGVAKRVLEQLIELIETNWFGENEQRINSIIYALNEYAMYYPNKEVIKSQSQLHIQYLQDTDHRYHFCEYLPFLTIWEILMAKLDT